ncbi:hypothetical protein [Kiloniella majae]|uniref:hypothetical protein n=1 Tax=Kiloniella majae TaxID=1938558 RepID=UPI000A278FB6|nr:hypothetical protein [Kiloniella majae]
MSDLRLVVFVFFLGFAVFFGLFRFTENDSHIEIVEDIPSKSGKSVTASFWEGIGISLGLIPEVEHPHFLSASRQSSLCGIARPSRDALIVWVKAGYSDFVSPIQIDSGTDARVPTGLINVSVGEFKKPVFLFLQSHTGVVWNLNVPDSVKVEGVVSLSMIPSAIANSPDKTNKLVITHDVGKGTVCPIFRMYPDNEPGMEVFQKEVSAYLGRKPDRMVIEESMSLAVIRSKDAPSQGLSRLDARKIYSPSNMLLGKKPYKELYVEPARNTGEVLRIDRDEAVSVLTASNGNISEDTKSEIMDQFLYVPENYRLIRADFSPPSNFLNEIPRTFFIPSDVSLEGIRIPPSINPEPRLPAALKPAPQLGEITEEEDNPSDSFENSVRMEKSDKYFRRIGKHAFAPLELTAAQILELIDQN